MDTENFCDTLLENLFNAVEAEFKGNKCFETIVKDPIYIDHLCTVDKKIPIKVVLLDWINRSYKEAKRAFDQALDRHITKIGSVNEWETFLQNLTNIATDCGISVKRIDISDLAAIADAVRDPYDGTTVMEFSYVQITFEDQQYYIRFETRYDSYSGTELESYSYVIPKTVTVTTFE